MFKVRQAYSFIVIFTYYLPALPISLYYIVIIL